MAVTNGVTIQQTIYFHKETTNQSFIDMHYYLKQTGRTNNAFFLVLYDQGLRGVDPRDPNLSTDLKSRVFWECKRNYWYYLREVVRIPDEGGSIGSGVRYKLDRGGLAMNFLYVLNYNQFVELPRQCGKTTTACCRYLWCYNFGTTNSEIMFLHKDHGGSKKNLRQLKNIRDALPEYLQFKSAVGADGKKLKVPNTIETMMHPINHNRIVTFASARSEAYADNLGRGCTQALQYYDEFGFMPYNQTVYLAATPANAKAAQNAKRHNAPYGIMITTTPGDILTKSGEFAYMVRNDATPWSEKYYDLSYAELEELRKSNRRSPFFLVSYSYRQLGLGEDYFEEMCVQLLRNGPKIRREVLLEWGTAATNCPFSPEDLDTIERFTRQPITTILLGRYHQYQLNVYKNFKDLDMRFPPIIGVDVSGAMYQDSSAITIIDSKTTEVIATLNCNYIPSDDLADVIYQIVTNFMRNAIINVERNGGFGVSVLQRLAKTSVKNNMYFEIKDKAFEEDFSNGRHVRKTRKCKVYGTDSTKEVRARLIEILYERVAMHKDKFVAPILWQEMKGMEVKKSGKVEHSDKTHDDQVFSYLMALRVWYDGNNLMERYGIMKNLLKTDEDLTTEDLEMEEEISGKLINVDTVVFENDHVQDIIEDQVQWVIAKQGSIKTQSEFLKQQDDEKRRAINHATMFDPIAKQAYMTKFHIDPDEASIGIFTEGGSLSTLPDELFDLDTDRLDEEESQGDHLVGVYADTWRRL